MSGIEKISIALTSEQVASLRAAVDGGDYATTSEAVREAIRDWQHKRELQRNDILRLRQLWHEGLASGTAGAVDFEAIKAEGRARLSQAKKAGRDAP